MGGISSKLTACCSVANLDVAQDQETEHNSDQSLREDDFKHLTDRECHNPLEVIEIPDSNPLEDEDNPSLTSHFGEMSNHSEMKLRTGKNPFSHEEKKSERIRSVTFEDDIDEVPSVLAKKKQLDKESQDYKRDAEEEIKTTPDDMEDLWENCATPMLRLSRQSSSEEDMNNELTEMGRAQVLQIPQESLIPNTLICTTEALKFSSTEIGTKVERE